MCNSYHFTIMTLSWWHFHDILFESIALQWISIHLIRLMLVYNVFSSLDKDKQFKREGKFVLLLIKNTKPVCLSFQNVFFVLNRWDSEIFYLFLRDSEILGFLFRDSWIFYFLFRDSERWPPYIPPPLE